MAKRENAYAKMFVTIRDEMLARLKGPKLSVYLCLVSHCGGPKMTCYPSLTTICRETGYSRPAVAKALAELEKFKLVGRERRMKANGSRDSTMYTVAGHFVMGEGSKPSLLGVVNQVNQGSKLGLLKEDPLEEDTSKEKAYLLFSKNGNKREAILQFGHFKGRTLGELLLIDEGLDWMNWALKDLGDKYAEVKDAISEVLTQDGQGSVPSAGRVKVMHT